MTTTGSCVTDAVVTQGTADRMSHVKLKGVQCGFSVAIAIVAPSLSTRRDPSAYNPIDASKA